MFVLELIGIKIIVHVSCPHNNSLMVLQSAEIPLIHIGPKEWFDTGQENFLSVIGNLDKDFL